MGAPSRVVMLRIKRKIMRAGLYPSACAWVDQLGKLHGVERGRVGRSQPNRQNVQPLPLTSLGHI